MKEVSTLYTNTAAERFSPTPKETDATMHIEKSKSVTRFVEKLSAVFSTTNTTVFNNGNGLEHPRSPALKPQFEKTLVKAVSAKCEDLFTADGKIKPETNSEWVNVLEIAPRVTEILLSEENYINSVNRSRAVNIVSFAIDVARNPDLLGETVINTGFGGSDDEFTTTRFPAYALPALSITRQLSEFYEKREVEAVKSFKSKKIFNKLLLLEDAKAGDADYKRKRQDAKENAEKILKSPELAAEHGLDPTDVELTDKEKESVKREKGIASVMPKVRFFFGHEAAIAINGTMQPDKIKARTAENQKILRDFVDENFPDFSENVEIIEDMPWSEHSRYQKLVIDYCAHLLRTSDDQSVKKALSLLEKLGENHGGDTGSERSAEYAAIHPLVFQDRLNLPYTSLFRELNTNPTVNITIGGKAEKSFYAVREYLTENTSADGLIAFINEQIFLGSDHDPSSLIQMIEDIQKWKANIEASRSKYSPNSFRVDISDRPNNAFQLTTSIGELPTYYARVGFDMPYGSDIILQIKELESQPPTESTAMERFNHNLVKGFVIFDLKALQKEKIKKLN